METHTQKLRNDFQEYENNVGQRWQELLARVSSQVTQILISKPHHNENDVSNCIYDECKRTLKPVTRWIAKNSTCQSKDAILSDKLRKQGCECFAAHCNERGLYYFTKSILYAPKNSVELALAYANRSELFFANSNFEDCVQDIMKSMENPCPDQIKLELSKRLEECTVSQDKIFVEQKTAPRQQLPTPTYGNNPLFDCASNALQIDRIVGIGRVVKATKDIKQGDILFVEEPYCFSTDDQDLTTCSFCCTKTTLFISCAHCVEMFYCSDVCHDTCWSLFHRWECSKLKNIFGQQLGVAHLAMRIVVKSSLGCLYTPKDCEPGVYEKTNYQSLYDLETNLYKMEIDDIATYAVMAVALVYYLKIKTDFFSWYVKNSTGDEQNLSRLLCSRVLRHLCQLQCNAHSVVLGGDANGLQRPISRCAIYTSASMMNHSCDSNIVNEYYKQILIVRAIRDIPAGDQIFNSYGVSYFTHPRHERLHVLKSQYYFDCTCKPCTDVALLNYYELRRAVVCSSCTNGRLIYRNDYYECINCKRKLPEREAKNDPNISLFKTLFMSLDDKRNVDLKLLTNCVFGDSYDLLEFYSTLSDEFESIGDHSSSVNCAKFCLKHRIEEHGSNSYMVAKQMLEVAIKMVMLLEQLVSNNADRYRVNLMETKQFCMQTRKRLEVFFGSWNDKLLTINELEAKVDTISSRIENQSPIKD